MGKRSNFKREERDYYPTPIEAVFPLLPFLPPISAFGEVCAGDGRLIHHLESAGHKCVYACDIEPLADYIERRDVLFFDEPLPPMDLIVTNPPWDRAYLHPIIDRLRHHCDTWLLFDADWMHTGQATPYLPYCRRIVSVGRVKWIPDSKMSGMDNCCWYLFGKEKTETNFYGRT